MDTILPSTELETTTVSAAQVAAMSNITLRQFLGSGSHRLPNGDYQVLGDGWRYMPSNQGRRLPDIIEAEPRSPSMSHTKCSRPVDPVELRARLRQISPNRTFTLRPELQMSRESRCRTEPLPDPVMEEREAYRELFNDGGRPLYHVDLIRDVFGDRDNYAELLHPWQDDSTELSVCIFQKQWRGWQDFRKWQNDHRDREDDESGFQAYVERQKRKIQRDYIPSVAAKRLAKIEADPSTFKWQWDWKQSLRERQRLECREPGCRDFRDYREAVNRRLAHHGLTQDFYLDLDAKRQDKLTTWIEYTNYEYWRLDQRTSALERREQKLDKLWQQLVDNSVVRPHEKKKYMCTHALEIQGNNDKDRAIENVQMAESEARRIYELTQESPNCVDIPPETRLSMLKESRDKLIAARLKSDQANKQADLITEFVRLADDLPRLASDAARQRVRVQWVLDQIPLIESEINLSESSRPVSDGRRRTKRRRTDEEPAGGATPEKGEVWSQRLPGGQRRDTHRDAGKRQTCRLPQAGPEGCSGNAGRSPS